MSAQVKLQSHATRNSTVVKSHPLENPASLTIDQQGLITDCNESASFLFGFEREELLSQHVSRVLPQLVNVEWVEMGQPNHHLSYLAHIGHHFAAVTQDGRHFATRLFLNDLSTTNRTRILLVIRLADYD